MTTVERIHARGRFSGKAGLHRIRALCDALGNPQRKLKFVHIAGTNGKGSTAAMLAAIFQQAGYRTGLYTSPYLVTFHERIQVDGCMIAGADLERLAARVEAVADMLTLPEGEHIGEFEFVTALGFLYFAEQACDIVILETGLGGRYDATNVIDAPEAAIITSISFDHTAVLGNTLEEIAYTKAGIFKPGSAAVCAPGQPAGAEKTIVQVCPDVQIPPQAEQVHSDWNGVDFTWQGSTYHVSLIGLHQVQNACTVLQAVRALQARGWVLTEEHIKAGLWNAKIPGRMQILRQNPTVLVDGGHNVDGVKAICSTIQSLPRRGKLHLVLGMVADKDVKACARQLAALTDSIFVTQPQNERALAAEELAKYLPSAEVRGVFSDSAAAFHAALDAARMEDLVFICGSLYLVGEAEKFFAE